MLAIQSFSIPDIPIARQIFIGDKTKGHKGMTIIAVGDGALPNHIL